MTGVTLPLISYGGSSVMCTIFMLAIVQGLYVLRKDETIEDGESDTEEYEPEPGRQIQAQQQRPVQQYAGQPRPGYQGPVQQPSGQQPRPAGQGFVTAELERKIEEATEESLRW